MNRPGSALPAEALLALPTYDGSGQVVHPDVLYVPDGHLGRRFFLAMTPYPYGDDRRENPSLLVGDDGVHFVEPFPGLNPLVPPPPKDHNDDPDVALDPRTGALTIHYLETVRPERQSVVRLTSLDAEHWERANAVDYDLAVDPLIHSPALRQEGPDTHLYFVAPDLAAPVQYLVSPDGLASDKSLARAAALVLPEGLHVWHLDVFAGEKRRYLLLCAWTESFDVQSLWLATSDDLGPWTLRPTPLLTPGPARFRSESLYRATGVVRGNRLAVWYSFRTVAGA